jgi:hypothetical protein
MKPLPLPLRVAAGLAVTAVDRARHLPERLVELPVTMVSQALQLSMRVQQQVTELAIKGDEALSTLRPVEEAPEWATFDEDKLDDSYDAGPGWATEHNGSRSKFDSVELSAVEVDELGDAEVVDEGRHTGTNGPTSDDQDDADLRPETDDDPSATQTATGPDSGATAIAVADGPSALPTYPELSVPQLRARLRRLDIEQLAELIDFEHSHANRPEFVGMLTRRMNTLRDQQ